MKQVVLNSTKVLELMNGRYPFELAAASGQISGNAVRRAMNGLPVTAGIAQHIADVLGVRLRDLIVREVEHPMPGGKTP